MFGNWIAILIVLALTVFFLWLPLKYDLAIIIKNWKKSKLSHPLRTDDDLEAKDNYWDNYLNPSQKEELSPTELKILSSLYITGPDTMIVKDENSFGAAICYTRLVGMGYVVMIKDSETGSTTYRITPSGINNYIKACEPQGDIPDDAA